MFDRLTLKTQITGTAGGPDPESPVGKAIASETQSAGQSVSGLALGYAVGAALDYALEDNENLAALTGKTGVADSILRPSGRALIDGKIYTVEADNEFVEAGKGIIVTRVRGNRIIVRRV
jgi:membrane-bound serine protease (ClpP class)